MSSIPAAPMVGPQGQATHTQILSVVVPIPDGFDEPAQISSRLEALHGSLTALGTPFELVVVVGLPEPDVVESIRTLSERLPDIQVYVLQNATGPVTARFAGMENAIGDWVATIDLQDDPPDVVGLLLQSAKERSCEVVVGSAPASKKSLGEKLLSVLFNRTFRAIHGFSLSEETGSARLLSRSVVNAILGHDSPAMALDVLPLLGGFRRTTVAYQRTGLSRMSFRDKVRARWRTLLGVNPLPLRIANGLCGVGAVLSLFYSLYVVGIYLYKDDVVPGWTTVSLMISSMFLLISLVLLLLSEYMILLLDAGARRPRFQILTEFTSPVIKRRSALNVEREL